MGEADIRNAIKINECYIKGTCGDLRFKNVETPSIANLYNDMIELNIDSFIYKYVS